MALIMRTISWSFAALEPIRLFKKIPQTQGILIFLYTTCGLLALDVDVNPHSMYFCLFANLFPKCGEEVLSHL